MDASGSPRVGAFTGPLPAVTLARSMLRTKKWVWLGISAGDVWATLALVRTGYAATVFAFVADRTGMLAERVVLATPQAVRVSDAPHDDVTVASAVWRGARVGIDRREGAWAVRGVVGPIAFDAELVFAEEGQLSVVAPLGPGRLSATEKRAPLHVLGRITVAGRVIELDGGRAGYDYTHGHMPRHTRWRWAFGLDRDLALNLTSGFVGAAECALLRANGAVVPVAEPRIDFGRTPLERAWTLEGEGIDLRFEPVAAHAQSTNLVLVRSRFVQCVGRFRGTVAGNAIDMPGVVEDQDSLW
jgi:hypothetical protein